MKRTIILDFGSGETNTDPVQVKEMIDKVVKYRSGLKNIIIKFQMWTSPIFYKGEKLKSIEQSLFAQAFAYCKLHGLECTSSVFDLTSLNLLLDYKVNYIKLACREHVYSLIPFIPRDKKILVSFDSLLKYETAKCLNPCHQIIPLWCVPRYPACIEDYKQFDGLLENGISDHTIGFDLEIEYEPLYWEKHVCYEHGPKPDQGAFACTIDEIKEWL